MAAIEMTTTAATTASPPTMAPEEVDPKLHQRTLLKLDCLLLPFLAALFLFNALDKANVSPVPTRTCCCMR